MLPETPTPPKPSPSEAPLSTSARVAQVIWIIFGLIEALIALRVGLRLGAANPDAGFTNLIYTLSQPFVVFFQGVFPTPARNGNVLELSSVLALVVYPVLSWAIVHLVQIVGRKQPTAKS
jgi:YGGT family